MGESGGSGGRDLGDLARGAARKAASHAAATVDSEFLWLRRLLEVYMNDLYQVLLGVRALVVVDWWLLDLKGREMVIQARGIIEQRCK